MRKNKGYTLVEMIIVIAIIAIMSGVSVVTVGVIKEAKVNSAVDNFNNQLTSLWIKTKALSNNSKPLCMEITKNPTPSSGDDIRDGSYVLKLGYMNGGTFEPRKDDSGNEEKPIEILTELVTIEYVSTDTPDGSTKFSDSADKIIIQYNKSDGSVISGAGNFNFKYKNNDYGAIVLDKVTGNHYKKGVGVIDTTE